MGYNIYYEGVINLDKPLDDKTLEIIIGLAETRRMLWDANKLDEDGIAKKDEIGFGGEFFFGIKELSGRKLNEFESKYVVDHNCPPWGQPDLWGVWTVTDDRKGLVWNRKEKSYCGHEWLKYIVKRILIPKGYYPSGIVNWFTEESMYDNKRHTVVEGKSVRKYRGYSSKQEEPDIHAWYDEEIKAYEKCHQEWIKGLIENKIKFLHESLPWREYNTNEKSVLSFNIYFENNIIQVVYDRKRICKATYLYRSIRQEGDILIHDEHSGELEKVELTDTLNALRDMMEKYIEETPGYLDRAVV